MRITILSDTHGMVHPGVAEHLAWADEVWHAGDLGPVDTLRWFQAQSKVFRAVSGNADPRETLRLLDETAGFEVQGIRVMIHHIVGKPGKYVPQARTLIEAFRPDWVVCGHSHILQVAPLPGKAGGLHINPGAAGQHGFHSMCTLLRFTLDEGKLASAEVVELGPRGRMYSS